MTGRSPYRNLIDRLARLWAPLLVLILMISGCHAAGGLQNIVKDRFRLAVMTLNIVAALPAYGSNPEIPLPWRDRYTRIADGLKSNATTPDIIALQEVTARKEWVFHRDPNDYESIHYLISMIKGAIGIEYRIAYLGATTAGEPGLIAGEAVLYNPARLKNITRAPSASALPGDKTPTALGVHPRKSFPCVSPASEFMDLCPLLDGEGIYYTSIWADDAGKRNTEIGAVRFTFTADDQYGFNFYNVHLHPTSDVATDKSNPAAVSLIDFMEGLKYSGNLYPPIVAGDFNGGTERIPNFGVLAASSPPPDVDAIDFIIGGNRTTYSAKYGFSVVKTAMLPSPGQNPDHICAPREVAWSDHCALLADLEPVM